ncbi:MAG: filamentous hemagglutinin N-terminal domain-containing protein, partial [Verrucomicrobiales bacterium]|nr:filamentous hemagglutinin N-terminal domain-containing protein [Verrucomicrobiales bacterium]
MRNITSSFRRYLVLQVLILASLFPGLALFPTPLRANPAGASVVHGNVAFNGLGTSQLNVMQGSQSAIINWQSFSIQSGETTNFVQPNQNSIALNRVVGADP